MAMSSVLGPWIRSRHGYAIAVVLTATAFAAAGPAAADATPTSPRGGDGRAGSKPTVVLVHDGAVISSAAAAGNPQVQSLVYISAFMPDKGEAAGISATAFVNKVIPDVERFETPDAVTDLILNAAGAQSPAKPTLAETGSRARDLTAVGGVAVATVLAGASLFAVTRKRRNSKR